ncbi:MAG: methyltransferase domain-containing protein [Clostridia bacterium]|jgi:SAM-dependent methyltransferase
MIICPICETTNEFTVKTSKCNLPEWRKQDLIRYQCSNCDVIFGPLDILKETTEELKERYIKLYNSGWRETDSTDIELDIISKLNLQSGQNCLNWGGGSLCTTKQHLNKRGILLDIYEPFDPFAKNVITNSDNLGIYDAIISNNVIEHLQDPINEFKLMLKHLKNNGSMIHSTPCWDYVYEWTEYHLFFFVGKSISVLSDKVGLKHHKLSNNYVQFNKI